MPAPAPEIHEGVPPQRSLLGKSARDLPPPVDCFAVEHQQPTPHLKLIHCSGATTTDVAGCPDWTSFVQSEQRATVDPTHLYAHTVRYH
jgi:hypothetical protein